MKKIEKLNTETNLHDLSFSGFASVVRNKINELIEAHNSNSEDLKECFPKSKEDKEMERLEKLNEEMQSAVRSFEQNFKNNYSVRIIEEKEEQLPEILGCPFCGVKPERTNNREEYYIRCGNDKCSVLVQTIGGCDLKNEISEWNTRSKK